MEKVTINDFWKVCKKYFLVISLLPIIVVTIVFIINKMIVPPKYETTTQLLISMQKSNVESYDFDSLRSSMQLVDTFSSIAQSEKVMKEVISQLHLKNNSNKVTVITDEKSLIINVNVTGKDKKQVVDVANGVAVNAQGKFKELFNGMNVNILAKAEESQKVSSTYKLILGAIIGFMSSLVFIFSILFFSSIITKEEEITQLGYVVLGDVPLMKPKKEDVYV
ncbi:hypothetical protein FC683_19305 [Bacillus cereus]|uniref:YveK family protein n=1 Tax=Bacillus cereus TaxID=1396 RepID=UPI0010BCFF38|nr:Wzz/FepE/Etk N-terminal domain-containing protein [Bacillus cereus]TKI28932.1 hypothetical protein FC683_19305 [Bacillus cereus]